jgi:hypothetical protein
LATIKTNCLSAETLAAVTKCNTSEIHSGFCLTGHDESTRDSIFSSAANPYFYRLFIACCSSRPAQFLISARLDCGRADFRNSKT